jgi:hypothetical protein
VSRRVLQVLAPDGSIQTPEDVVILLVSRRMLQVWALKVQEKQALPEPFTRGWQSLSISRFLGPVFLIVHFL